MVARHYGMVNRWAGPVIQFSPLAKLIFTIISSEIKVTAYNSSVELLFRYMPIRVFTNKALNVLLGRLFTLF